MSDDLKVKGLDELLKALDQLPAQIEQNIMRGALRAGCNVLKKEAQANAPFVNRTGDLRKSLRVDTKIDRLAGKVLGFVRAGNEKAYYASWVEYGRIAVARFKGNYEDYRLRGRGRLTGLAKRRRAASDEKIGARPFLRPALDHSAQAAIEAVREYIRKRLATKHGLIVPGPDPIDSP